MSLAIEYRPTCIEDVVGNKTTCLAIDVILKRKREEIQHSWLFTGLSGGGKTTFARIVAERLGSKGSDICEVDCGALAEKVAAIRTIREQMYFMPMESSCRVWILDEVHLLSKDAMSALLKVLEDTPSHVYIMLATTDPQKLLPTIRNRCVHFEVQPVADDEMEKFLREIVSTERKRMHPDVLAQIAGDAMGSCRAALQVLDKVIDLPAAEQKAAAEQIAATQNQVIELCFALMAPKTKWSVVAKILEGLGDQEPEGIRRAVMGYCVGQLKKGDRPQAFVVMDCFRLNTYDNGMSQIWHSAYAALESNK